MKQEITLMEHAGTILAALPKGVLLTTSAGERCNTMVIGWGTMGIEWGKPVFIAYVRQSRYTKELLDQNPEFTVNIPLGKPDPNVIAVCGRQSGREIDKFAACGLTPEAPEKIGVPGIREFPLTLECRVIYRQTQAVASMPEDVQSRYYADGDEHTAYYGEIVSAYLIS